MSKLLSLLWVPFVVVGVRIVFLGNWFQPYLACTTPNTVRLRWDSAVWVSRSRCHCHLKFSKSDCRPVTSSWVAGGEPDGAIALT